MDLTEITELDADRVDGVGNPANGLPFLMIKSVEQYQDFIKSKYTAEQLRELKAKGETYPGTTSYPIADDEDLENAIHAVGRGKVANHNAIRAYIIRRAKALGKSDQIPDNWQADGALSKEGQVKPPKCETCNGTGQVHDPGQKGTVCPDCNGTGFSSDVGDGDGMSGKGENLGKNDGNGNGDTAEPVVAPTTTPSEEVVEPIASTPSADDAPGGGNSTQMTPTAKELDYSPVAEYLAKAGRRLSNKSLKLIRQVIADLQALEAGDDGGGGKSAPISKGKDIEKMTPDELVKALGEVEARRDAEKLAKKMKAEKKAKKIKARDKQAAADAEAERAKDRETEHLAADKPKDDQVAKSLAAEFAEELAKAVAPLQAKIAEFENRPVNNIPANALATVVQRGEAPKHDVFAKAKASLEKALEQGDAQGIAQSAKTLSLVNLANYERAVRGDL